MKKIARSLAQLTNDRKRTRIRDYMTTVMALDTAWREWFADTDLPVRRWNGTHPAKLIIRDTSRTADVVVYFVVASFSVVEVGVGVVERYLELVLLQEAVAGKNGGFCGGDIPCRHVCMTCRVLRVQLAKVSWRASSCNTTAQDYLRESRLWL
jgi:hypothetical protein